MVVAELLAAHAGAAAAGVVGEDVVALVVVVGLVVVDGGFVVHGYPPVLVQSLQCRWFKSGLRAQFDCQTVVCGLKRKAPAGAGACSLYLLLL